MALLTVFEENIFLANATHAELIGGEGQLLTSENEISYTDPGKPEKRNLLDLYINNDLALIRRILTRKVNRPTGNWLAKRATSLEQL